MVRHECLTARTATDDEEFLGGISLEVGVLGIACFAMASSTFDE